MIDSNILLWVILGLTAAFGCGMLCGIILGDFQMTEIVIEETTTESIKSGGVQK